MSEYNPNIPPKKRPVSLQLDAAKFEPATDEEKAQQEVMRESTTFFRDGMRKLFRNPLAVGSMIVLLVFFAAMGFLGYKLRTSDKPDAEPEPAVEMSEMRNGKMGVSVPVDPHLLPSVRIRGNTPRLSEMRYQNG